MRLCPVLTCYAPRKRGLTWVTRLTVFLLITASAGWLLNFIKHSI